MYEYLMSTGVNVKQGKVFVYRTTTSMTQVTFNHHLGTALVSIVLDNSVQLYVGDNISNTEPRFFYIKPLNRDSASGLTSVKLNHPAGNIMEDTLSPLYTI